MHRHLNVKTTYCTLKNYELLIVITVYVFSVQQTQEALKLFCSLSNPSSGLIQQQSYKILCNCNF